jgi:hypothetical protein
MRRRHTRGASLVEVIIAASILAVVLLAFISIMFSSSQLSASARETTIASSILQSHTEDLFSLSYQQFWEGYFGHEDATIGATLLFNRIVLAGLKTGTPEEYEKFSTELSSSGRLRNEVVTLHMLSSSDTAESDARWRKHAWVDFKLKVTWTDNRGKPREEFLISRRSR